MSTVRTIAKNTTVLAVAQVASYLLGFFYTVYIARSLGVASFGIITFAAAITSIFGPLADLGLASLMIREVARDKSAARRYLAQLTLMKMLLAVATFGAIALTVFLGDYPWQTVLAVYLLAISLLVNSFNGMVYSVFNASEKMEYPALGQFLNAALMFIGVMVAVRYHVNVVGFAFLYVYASVAVLIYSLVVLRRQFASAAPSLASILKPEFAFWKDTLRQAWPFAFSAIFMTIAYSTDSVMLSFMKGDEAVGSYSAALRLISTLGVIPMIYLTSVYPVMSRMFLSSDSSLRFMVRKSFQYLLTIAVPIGVGTTVLAGRIVWEVYGAEYSDSEPVLQVLIWSMVFNFPAYVLSTMLYSINKQMAAAKIIAVCALLNVVLNAILIPRYSGTGAAIATVATQFGILTLSGISCARTGYGIRLSSLLALLARIAVASAAMCAVVLYLDNLILWALIPLAALLYFGVLLLVRGIGTKEDVELVQAIVRRQPGQT